MDKLKKILRGITITLFVVVILVVIYFSFINKDTKYYFDEALRVDPNYKWVLNDLSKSVEDYDIYKYQDSIYNTLVKNFNKKKPDINNPMVIVDPYGISPQTALLMFKTKKDESVTITIKGKHNDDITRTFEKSKDHIIPIYGLYGGYDNTVIVKTESGSNKTLNIKIDKVCSDTVDKNGNVINVSEINDSSNSDGNFYFGTSSYTTSSIAYDNYGEVRWYLNLEYSRGITVLKNGNLLLSSYSKGPNTLSSGGLVEVDMFGRTIHEYYIDSGYHHDAFEMENGNLLILSSNNKSDTVFDTVLEIDQDAKIVNQYDIKSIFDEIDPSIATIPSWAWVNSVYFDNNTSSLIVSLRNLNSIVSIDANSKKINWILGDKKYLSDSFNDYLLNGIGDNFVYPLGQHSINFIDGNLSIFDNGYDAYKEESLPCSTVVEMPSYARIYKINQNDKTAELIWSYGGKEYSSYNMSSFNYTNDNHKLINFGWHISNAGLSIDYCNQFNNNQFESFIIELDQNDNILNKLHLRNSKIEVVKTNIYSNNNNYKPSHAKISITNKIEPTGLSLEEANEYMNLPQLMYPLNTNNGFLDMTLALANTHDIDVVLISSNGHAYKYRVRSKGEFTQKPIYYSDLPRGKYHVFVVDNEDKYDTLQYIEIN